MGLFDILGNSSINSFLWLQNMITGEMGEMLLMTSKSIAFLSALNMEQEYLIKRVCSG